DSVTLLGHHANAIALPQAAEKVFFGPGEIEARLLGLKDFGHIPPDHPADVNANLCFFCATRAHEQPPPSPHAHPLRGSHASASVPVQPAAISQAGGMLNELGGRQPLTPTSPPDISNAPFPAQGHSSACEL